MRTTFGPMSTTTIADADQFDRLTGAGLALADQAERIARLIAPEDLRRRPLYIILATGDDAKYLPANSSGCTGTFYDLSFRDLLRSRMLWKGRGFAILVAPAPRDNLFACLCHELAHCTERRFCPAYWDFEPDDHPPGSLERLCGTPYIPRAETGIPTAPPFDKHGPDFLRCLIHVHYRAELLGLRFHEREIFAHRVYGLSALSGYARRLSDEPRKWLGRPIADLADVPTPAAFAELFAADESRWRRRHDRFQGNTEHRAAAP
jgi:hypothetical protein